MSGNAAAKNPSPTLRRNGIAFDAGGDAVARASKAPERAWVRVSMKRLSRARGKDDAYQTHSQFFHG